MMELKNIQMSCWNKKEISTGSVEEDYLCPVCNGHTQKVNSITVKHFVIDSLMRKIKDEDFYICLNDECDVTYFNSLKDLVFRAQDLKIPIWFKKGARPKYICYCNDVTEDEIINAVLRNGARNIKDIIKLTGAMRKCNCEANNPLGKCCSPFIQETINKAMNL